MDNDTCETAAPPAGRRPIIGSGFIYGKATIWVRLSGGKHSSGGWICATRGTGVPGHVQSNNGSVPHPYGRDLGVAAWMTLSHDDFL